MTPDLNELLRAELARVKAQNRELIIAIKAARNFHAEFIPHFILEADNKRRQQVAEISGLQLNQLKAILAEAQKEGEARECRKDS